jgi:hypothetical protein
MIDMSERLGHVRESSLTTDIDEASNILMNTFDDDFGSSRIAERSCTYARRNAGVSGVRLDLRPS